MELSLVVKNYLRNCGCNKEISDSYFKKLLDHLIHSCDSNSFEQLQQYQGYSDERSKLITSLYLLLTEASRNNTEPTFLQMVLDELNWNHDRTSMFLTLYDNRKSELRWRLSSCTIFPLQIVDVNWKLDYIAKDNTGTSVGSLSYLITLHVQNPSGKSSPIIFKCNLAELTHFVTRLRQASRCIQKYAIKT